MRRSARSGRGLLALAAIAGSAAAVVAESGARRTESHPYFAAREIDVEAHGGAGPEDARSRGRGSRRAMSIWSVHTSSRRNDGLLAHPRIREASLECTLPEQVRIRRGGTSPRGDSPRRPPAARGGRRSDLPRYGRRSARRASLRHGLFRERSDLARTVGSASATAARLVALWQTMGRGQHFRDPPRRRRVRGVRRAARRWRCASPPKQGGGLRPLAAVLELWRGREAQVAAIDLSLPGQAVLKLRAPPHGAARPGSGPRCGPPNGRPRRIRSGGRDARILASPTSRQSEKLRAALERSFDMAKRSPLIVGLDIGTYKISAVVAEIGENG